jgi:prepilin-type N-terminal cleavage/methylation domain-containing protein
MTLNLKKKTEGFTIIEVLIVLAIAGLIMLIVFLAVPALQRNARNTQRNHDASLVLAAVNECLNNHNGIVASCDSTAEVAVDTNNLAVLKTYDFGAASYAQTNARVIEGAAAKCSADGASAAGGGTARDVSVTFQLETGTGTSNRCIGQ